MIDRLAAFLAMGGHGGFVWGAYAIAAIVLLAILAASLLRVQREERALQRLAEAGGRRGRARAPAGPAA